MVGKWHLGHGQMKQTPTGRGFQRFLGNYMWDIDSYTKQMFEDPFESALMIDWIRSYDNGTYSHYVDEQHAMTLIHDEAIQIIESHNDNSLRTEESQKTNPLFLYVAYTAAHSPLQPLPRHMLACQHIPHLWRRLFCGMVQAIDESVHGIIISAMKHLDPTNTLVIIASDNGGSPWFGGMNFPYRGSKGTTFEGGIKVPAIIADLSSWTRIAGNESALLEDIFLPSIINRKYSHLFHACDWVPTLLGLAGISESTPKFDGLDLSSSVTNTFKQLPIQDQVTRQEMLLELYELEGSVWKQDMFAYRLNDMKLIQASSFRDEHYYYPSSVDSLNSSAKLITYKRIISNFGDRVAWKYAIITNFMEYIIRFVSLFLPEGSFDGLRIFLTHSITQERYSKMPSLYFEENALLTNYTSSANAIRQHKVYLFNITADPYEQNNLALNYPDIVSVIQQKIWKIRDQAPPQPKIWYQYHLTNDWIKTHVPGDCSKNRHISEKDCRFTHPWIPDNEDAWKDMDKLVDGRAAAMQVLYWKLSRLLTILVIITIATITFLRRLIN